MLNRLIARLVPIVLALFVSGCGALAVTTMSDGAGDVTYASNSSCGSAELDGGVGLYLEQRGTIPNWGHLELWAYNRGDRPVKVQVRQLLPFRFQATDDDIVDIPPSGILQLADTGIDMPMYGAARRAAVDVAVGGTAAMATISLREHTYRARLPRIIRSVFEPFEPGYWQAVVGGCTRPTSIAEFESRATRDAILDVLDRTQIRRPEDLAIAVAQFAPEARFDPRFFQGPDAEKLAEGFQAAVETGRVRMEHLVRKVTLIDSTHASVVSTASVRAPGHGIELEAEWKLEKRGARWLIVELIQRKVAR